VGDDLVEVAALVSSEYKVCVVLWVMQESMRSNFPLFSYKVLLFFKSVFILLCVAGKNKKIKMKISFIVTKTT
jgi:hypothetical protein